MIEWLCTQEGSNPEGVIIFGTAARYRSSCLTSRNIVFRGKNADARQVQIFVKKLAANAGDFSILDCAALLL
jgi:hypothetical protein